MLEKSNWYVFLTPGMFEVGLSWYSWKATRKEKVIWYVCLHEVPCKTIVVGQIMIGKDGDKVKLKVGMVLQKFHGGYQDPGHV